MDQQQAEKKKWSHLLVPIGSHVAEGLFEALMGRQLSLTAESKVLDLSETSPPCFEHEL